MTDGDDDNVKRAHFKLIFLIESFHETHQIDQCNQFFIDSTLACRYDGSIVSLQISLEHAKISFNFNAMVFSLKIEKNIYIYMIKYLIHLIS